MVASSTTDVTTCCVDVFVEDLFMFRFVSFRFKVEGNPQSNAVEILSLIFQYLSRRPRTVGLAMFQYISRL